MNIRKVSLEMSIDIRITQKGLLKKTLPLHVITGSDLCYGTSDGMKLKENDLMVLLDDRTKEILEYKLKYPDTSMDELAKIVSLETDKSITKSGINHHFRKLNEIVKKHKEK